MKKFINLFLALVVFSTANVSAQNKANSVGPEKGSLVIVGGGNVGSEIWARFVELAGGPNANIIYVPTAGDDSTVLKNDKTIKKLQELGVKNVTTLHTRDPKVANTEKFVEPIRQATGGRNGAAFRGGQRI